MMAIPGRIAYRWDDGEAVRAVVDFASEQSVVGLDFLPDAQVGDYVVVHAGFALTMVEPEVVAEVIGTAEVPEVACLVGSPLPNEPVVPQWADEWADELTVDEPAVADEPAVEVMDEWADEPVVDELAFDTADEPDAEMPVAQPMAEAMDDQPQADLVVVEGLAFDPDGMVPVAAVFDSELSDDGVVQDAAMDSVIPEDFVIPEDLVIPEDPAIPEDFAILDDLVIDDVTVGDEATSFAEPETPVAPAPELDTPPASVGDWDDILRESGVDVRWMAAVPAGQAGVAVAALWAAGADDATVAGEAGGDTGWVLVSLDDQQSPVGSRRVEGAADVATGDRR